MSEPDDEPARLAVVLNCQIPSSSEAYRVVPSEEKLMLRLRAVERRGVVGYCWC